MNLFCSTLFLDGFEPWRVNSMPQTLGRVCERPALAGRAPGLGARAGPERRRSAGFWCWGSTRACGGSGLRPVLDYRSSREIKVLESVTLQTEAEADDDDCLGAIGNQVEGLRGPDAHPARGGGADDLRAETSRPLRSSGPPRGPRAIAVAADAGPARFFEYCAQLRVRQAVGGGRACQQGAGGPHAAPS